ncbi:MAG: TetR/AcrR family transcriptional regulator [Bacteroidales bacterium]|nr:TetR/AcrR family transcriptional regulator [Bacteroidales bacterium]MCF8389118.1 TetR/AcrR family transcriptional regulator [Bacteroidales bacterium]
MVVLKDQVRDDIINVAAKIFTRFGYKKTTMEEIAMASRKGKSSIYYYFSSKEDIFRAVVEKEAEELRKDLKVAINEMDNPISQLKNFILFRIQKLKTLNNFHAALKSDHLAHFEFIENIRKEYDRDEIELVTRILKIGVEKEKFVIDDPDLAAVALVTALKGLEIPLFINKKHGRIEDRLENLIQFLFYGLIKR